MLASLTQRQMYYLVCERTCPMRWLSSQPYLHRMFCTRTAEEENIPYWITSDGITIFAFCRPLTSSRILEHYWYKILTSTSTDEYDEINFPMFAYRELVQMSTMIYIFLCILRVLIMLCRLFGDEDRLGRLCSRGMKSLAPKVIYIRNKSY